jgi:hypothetical protein
MEDSIMDNLDDQNDTQFDDRLESQREAIRQSLDAIANDVGMALWDAGLRFPVYLTIPNSGDALATFATPLDPSDSEWSQASTIVSRIVSKTLGDISLRTRPQECAMARATMSAADVTAD